MKKYSFYIAAILIALLIGRKANSQLFKPDLVQVKYADSVSKVEELKKEFAKEFSFIPLANKKIEDQLTVTEYKKYAQAFAFFAEMMFQTWLEERKRKK